MPEAHGDHVSEDGRVIYVLDVPIPVDEIHWVSDEAKEEFLRCLNEQHW